MSFRSPAFQQALNRVTVAGNHRSAIRGRRRNHDATALKQAASQPPAESRESATTWRLTRRLITGGRLGVFRAAANGDLGPGVYVVKRPNITADGLARALLCREAAVAHDVTSPNLLTVLAASSMGGTAESTLPYYEGVSISRLQSAWQKSPPAIRLALSIARQIASALAALHAAGWLHGQVAARHVIVSPQQHATLIDLTGSRRLASQECDAAWPTPLPATPVPELFVGHSRLTAAADVYALGSLLFEMLSGRPVFEASSSKQLAHCHRSQRPADMQNIREDVSLELQELVQRMLAKEPLRRPSMNEAVRWLAELEIEELTRSGGFQPPNDGGKMPPLRLAN